MLVIIELIVTLGFLATGYFLLPKPQRVPVRNRPATRNFRRPV